MTASFPSWIDQGVLQAGYGEAPETNVTTFKPDVGPPKLRRRTSISQDLIAFTMWLSSSDWQELLSFYRNVLLDGTQQFTWLHPRTQTAATFQFEGDAPKVARTFGITFEIGLTLRLISGGTLPVAYVDEGGDNAYVAEDGVTIYVTES